MNHKFVLLFILFCSCNTKNEKAAKENNSMDEDPIVANAKWHFYSYALDLQVFDRNRELLKPLDYELRIWRIINHNPDSVTLLISAYNGDTTNNCTFMPLGIAGITVTRNRIYTPVYHLIRFDKIDDNILIAKMDSLSNNLRQKILNKEVIATKWLVEQSKARYQ